MKQYNKSITTCRNAMDEPFESITSLLSMKLALRQLYVSEKASMVFTHIKGTNSKRKVLGDDFRCGVQEPKEILRPISEAILILEGDKSKISDSLPIYKTIILEITNSRMLLNYFM